MEGVELGHLTGQDLPGSQTAGANTPRHCCRFTCFHRRLVLQRCMDATFVNTSIQFNDASGYNFTIDCHLFRPALWQRFGSGLGSFLPETHWGSRSETRGGQHRLATSLCIRFTFLLRPDRKGSTSSLRFPPTTPCSGSWSCTVA